MEESPGTFEDDKHWSRDFDTSAAHSARVWNYWLGGKDNFAADREFGDYVLKLFPEMIENARADRAFLGRVVRYLVEEAGVRQFLDIGTGIPTADNTHEVAQRIAPECRVVYVDNDPIVLAHARALLNSAPGGVTDYIDADAREPGRILQRAARTLDFGRPVAIMMLGILHFVSDDEAHALVNQLLDAVCAGSYLVVAHPNSEFDPEALRKIAEHRNKISHEKLTYRPRAEILRYFERVQLAEPGLVSCSRWRPGPGDPDKEVLLLAGVGRKA